MKKLILITIVLILCSCSNWYNSGHIDEYNPCTFIVNDSIKIIAQETNIDNLRYHVYVNDIRLNYALTYHNIHNNMKELVIFLEWKYKEGEKPIKIRKKSNLNDCFKNFNK